MPVLVCLFSRETKRYATVKAAETALAKIVGVEPGTLYYEQHDVNSRVYRYYWHSKEDYENREGPGPNPAIEYEVVISSR